MVVIQVALIRIMPACSLSGIESMVSLSFKKFHWLKYQEHFILHRNVRSHCTLETRDHLIKIYYQIHCITAIKSVKVLDHFPIIEYCFITVSTCSQNDKSRSVICSIFLIFLYLISVMQLLQCDWYKNWVVPETGSVSISPYEPYSNSALFIIFQNYSNLNYFL